MQTKQATHTPGPWEARMCGGSGDKWDVHQKTDTIDGAYFCQIEAGHWTEEARAIARANAKLIAAAPELLAALQWIADFEDNECDYNLIISFRWEAVGEARRAIAKARG